MSFFNPHRVAYAWRFSVIGLCIFIMSACLESSVECTSDGACASGLVCVNTQCVGAEVSGDSYQIYQEEIHLRLVSQCGICHGIKGENPTLVTASVDMGMPMVGEEVEENVEMVMDPCEPNLEALAIPKLPVILGDSGWRIFLDNLNEERMRASYEDTMQYINIDRPEDSLLLAYGRGEVSITKEGRLHPKVYPSAVGEVCNVADLPMIEMDVDMGMMGNDGMDGGVVMGGAEMQTKEMSKSDIIYQRMGSWAGIPHRYFTGTGQFNLESYQSTAQKSIERKCGCHGQTANNPISNHEWKTFYYTKEASEGADIANLAILINPNEPEKSALIGLAFGEYDHPAFASNGDEEYTQAILDWIKQL